MRVLGALCCGFELSEDGIGCVILEWREDVLLGIIRLLSLWSRVVGRASRSLVRGRVKDVCVLKEGDILLNELLSWLGMVYGYGYVCSFFIAEKYC